MMREDDWWEGGGNVDRDREECFIITTVYVITKGVVREMSVL